MSRKARRLIIISSFIIVGLCALFWGLVYAKGFLAPIAVAALLTMLVLPISQWLEQKGVKRGWAALICVLMILLFCIGLGAVVGAQVESVAKQWPEIEDRLEPQLEALQHKIEKITGVPKEQQDKEIGLDKLVPGDESEENGSPPDAKEEASTGNDPKSAEKESSAGTGLLSSAGNVVMAVFSFLGTYLLVLIYMFFFLLYRHKFSNTVLKIVPEKNRNEARDVITRSSKVSQSYLLGRLLLILILAILYSIGLSISGVQQAILISVIAAVLSLVPYIGNVIGFVLAFAMAAFSGLDTMIVLGIVITFTVSQFVESYFLEPYIVGDKVDLNPVMVIVIVVLGEAVWGVVGMVIAIPALGIVKVVCDQVQVLQPFGYLLGQDKPQRSVLDRKKDQ